MSPSNTTDRSRTAGEAGHAPGRADDRALIERCRQGELGAFEELYRAHSGRLFSLTLRIVGNAADAEDVLQEIFLAVHRKLDTFRGDSALGTWMYRLATNLCLDYLRSRSTRSSQVTDSLDDEPWLADANNRRMTDQTVSRMDLERALALLPEG